MFFADPLELDRALRQLRSIYGGVSDELRGWNWSNDVLSPPLEGVYLGVSEVANRYCPTYRDIYLRRVLGRPAPYTYKTVRGWIYHAISSKTVQEVKSTLYLKSLCSGAELFHELLGRRDEILESIFKKYAASRYLNEQEMEGLRREAEALYSFLTLQASARLDRILSEIRRPELESVLAKAVPMDVERLVNGRLLGLSQELRVDLFTERRIVVEIKTGDVRPFHKYVLAGYALAIESDLEIPIDYGIVSYLWSDGRFVKVRNITYFIGDELRREFLELRDEAFNVIHNGVDPRKPANCPSYCIYYDLCNR
ncbi:type I-A CRISPR-associated protein Cas4/Csa1 [Candidatus Bathyarchaeota archaeon]|nr:type I-A CRISPR-associated protein Cas4/Csa1 [Candidatus Bathyarchaeota archaeon]